MRQIQTIIILFFIAVLTISLIGVHLYQKVNKPNVKMEGTHTYVFIPTGSGFDDLKDILYGAGLIENTESFEWIAEKKNLGAHIIPGKYKIRNGMSNNQLVNLLRAGREEEVNVVFHNIRTKEQLAGRIAGQIEADSVQVLELLHDQEYIQSLGYDKHSVISLFIPNTYRFYWDTDAKEFMERMVAEHNRFWNQDRTKKAQEIGLNELEVMTLASIVEEETKKNDEKQRLAGVYINRLQKGWKLQADPTVIFAIGDFSKNRVLTKDLEFDSPYNTYKYKGLPPGPINIPSIASIDAVLNYEKHSYLYFCAREDFSGYHYFSKTLKQHNEYANRYKKALDQMKIYR